MQETNAGEWQAPPPPEQIKAEEPPQMSEAATLGNIFIEPGRTFEDLRRKPRFIFAALAIIVVMTGFQFLFVQKMGDERIRRFISDQIEKNPQVASMPAEQKQQTVDMQVRISSISRYFMPVFVIIGLLIGGLLYWLGTKAMGGSASFWQGLSVWVYSSFPPTVIMMLANMIVLFFKSADEIDIGQSQRGLVHANPSMFFDGKEMPVLATLIATLDFFSLWGWILAAIGLQKVGKLSSGAAWGIVLIFALVGIAFRVIMALVSGNPM
jgi:hypothetical protein